jgi:hypothetical protein
MPNSEGKVVVELRKGRGCRADSGRYIYVYIVMGFSPSGCAMLHCHMRWRLWKHQARIVSAASEARISAAAPRSLGEAAGEGKVRQRGCCVAARGGACGAPSVYSCGGAEERKGFGSDAAATVAQMVVPVGAPSAAAAGLFGQWRDYNISYCCAEKRRFRKVRVIRRDSLARCTTFGILRLAA